MTRRQPRRYNTPRVRRRRPVPSSPLFSRLRRQSESSAAGSGIRAPEPRGVRATAYTIILAIPILLIAWGLSFAVPLGIESYQAMGKIFVDPADRESKVDLAPTAPDEIPESVLNPATATPGSDAEDDENGENGESGEDDDPTATPTLSPTPTDEEDEEDSEPEANLTATATPFPRWNGEDPFHILLLGVDQRPSEEAPGRSDTIIVVRIDPEIPRVDMFSIPRDLLVQIPDYGGQKVNAAFPLGESSDIEGGGATLMAQTIEANFGIQIHHFATVDIPGLESIIDTMGGVIVDVDVQIKDDQYPTDDFGLTRMYFPTGLQRMNGPEAVQFARTRHPDNDFKRSERQQQLLIAMRDQALSSGIITQLPDLIREVGDAVRTDLSPRQTYALARIAQDMPRDNIYTHQITQYMSESSTSDGFYLIGDWEALTWVVQNLPEDPNATGMEAE